MHYMNKFPRNAIWKNADFDMPVIIVAEYGELNGTFFYKSATGTGIPAHELVWETAWQRLKKWLDKK